MKAKKIIARIYERIYPERVAQIRETNRVKRVAIQAMLDADRALRARGCNVARINAQMHDSLAMYKRGEYGTARSWAQMEMNRPEWNCVSA